MATGVEIGWGHDEVNLALLRNTEIDGLGICLFVKFLLKIYFVCCVVCICSSYCRCMCIHTCTRVYVYTHISMTRLFNCQVFKLYFVDKDEVWLFYKGFVLWQLLAKTRWKLLKQKVWHSPSQLSVRLSEGKSLIYSVLLWKFMSRRKTISHHFLLVLWSWTWLHLLMWIWLE